MTQELEQFYAGNWDRAYEYFGVHRQGDGWVFRVWAPGAKSVSLCGDFNGWQGAAMSVHDGVWELFVPSAQVYDTYKYTITGSDGAVRYKTDPYVFHAETRPKTAGKVYDLSGYDWHDQAWQSRETSPALNIYEVHLGSWRRKENGAFYSYRELGDALADYASDMGYNYVELLPVMEYPFDDSWGYQCTGYFAATSRYGTPHDLKYLVDRLHQANIGVILDWVPAHFCKDDHGLREFDGSCLYEYSDPLKWEHKTWGTRVFDYGKHEVRSFLLSSAAFWLREYHVDGLRVDAVASMLYLDYDRSGGQWRPNGHGGRENWEAIDFLRQLNTMVAHQFPKALMIAEESTAWPKVTHSVKDGGLGFSLKWNMGWMNDVCHYLKMDPFFRRDHHHDLTFAMMYAFSEHFVLPISHDEVVHMKGSLRGKMPGDEQQQLAAVRSFTAYVLCHPGKKLSFMGAELGQWHEWNHHGQLDWYLLDLPLYQETHQCIRALNRLYLHTSALWEIDDRWGGFLWLVADDRHNNVVVFSRQDSKGNQIIAVINFAPVAWQNYCFGVPTEGTYYVVFNTEDIQWGGQGAGSHGAIATQDVPSHGKRQSLTVDIPPLGALLLQRERKDEA